MYPKYGTVFKIDINQPIINKEKDVSGPTSTEALMALMDLASCTRTKSDMCCVVKKQSSKSTSVQKCALVFYIKLCRYLSPISDALK